MTVTPESLALQAQLDAEVQAVTDAQVRALVAAWALAWSEVSADLQDTLLELFAAGGRVTRATMLRSIRLRRALGTIADRLDTLAAQAGVQITSDLAGVVDQAANAEAQILAAQLPDLQDTVDLLDKPLADDDQDALAAIVQRTTEQITSLTKPLSAEAYDAVRRELIRGVAVGTNPKETARRMVRRAEGGFNGGLTRAMTIARTETLDAHRAAAQHAQDRHTDVLAGWVWLCHLGPRTCPACLARHGTLHDAGVAGPEGHQNCRCSRMPRTKSWADLGFEDLDEPADAVPDARAWFDALPKAEQLKIMGPQRLQLLQAGDVEWADLATLKKTAGWRDSWHVTPVGRLGQPSGGRRARSA